MSQYIGKIFWLNRERGFAFLSHDRGDDVYCHVSELQSVHHRSLVEGDEVQFDIRDGNEGPEAEHVMLLERKLPSLPEPHALHVPLAA